MIEKSSVEKSGVEKFVVEMSWVENVMVEKSVVEKFLLALGLNCPGYKFGVEKPGVEMSCNLLVLGMYNFVLPTTYFEEIFLQIRSCMHIPKLQQHVIFPLQFHFFPMPQSIKLH